MHLTWAKWLITTNLVVNVIVVRYRTVELSRRSVARALLFLRRAWHALRSALVICSITWLIYHHQIYLLQSNFCPWDVWFFRYWVHVLGIHVMHFCNMVLLDWKTVVCINASLLDIVLSLSFQYKKRLMLSIQCYVLLYHFEFIFIYTSCHETSHFRNMP